MHYLYDHNFAALIRSRHTTLYKCVLIDWLIDVANAYCHSAISNCKLFNPRNTAAYYYLYRLLFEDI